MKRYTRGFTLIELLVVIAIIGILSSVVLVSLSTARNKGKDASAQGSMSSIRAAAEMYNTGSGYGVQSTSVGTMSSTGTVANLTGVCADTTGGAGVQALLAAGAKQAGNSASCIVGLNGSTWVAYVTLSTQTSPANYCIDSTGYAGTLTTAPLHITPGVAVSCN